MQIWQKIFVTLGGEGNILKYLKGLSRTNVRSESFFTKILNTKKDTEEVKFLEKKLTRAWNGAKKDNKNLEYWNSLSWGNETSTETYNI